MNSIVLFRFHKNFSVCSNRLELLRKLNPGIKVYGLYGGPALNKVSEKIGGLLEGVYCVKNRSSEWKWKNGDLSVRQWFIDTGKKLSFDAVYIVEWDMLIFDPLEKICKNIPKDGLAINSLVLLRKVEDKWDWTSEAPMKKEWEKLLEYAKSEWNYEGSPYASSGPGFRLPRKFLEAYAKIRVPELCNDELRVPLFGQIFGFKLYDTGFANLFDKRSCKFYNAERQQISYATIVKELKKPKGRRIFHPYVLKWQMRSSNKDLIKRA